MTTATKQRHKTPQQNRKIFALAGQLGLEEHELRNVVEAGTGQRSISKLSYSGAFAVIRLLENMVGERRRQHRRVGAPNARASQGQLSYIMDLVEQCRFEDKIAFRAWLRRWFRVDHERWLNATTATKVITALKSMRER